MSEKGPKDELLKSNYDGIREYDNDLPNWWLTLFFVTIAFSFFYVLYRTMLHGVTAPEILAMKEKEFAEARAAVKEEAKLVMSGPELLALVKDKAVVEKGRTVYLERCAVCHGQSAEGSIGPNLTDKYWLHGGKILEIRHTIEAGVLDKGMLAWKGVLAEDLINSVVVYVKSLGGTNPPNAKAPQGTLSED